MNRLRALPLTFVVGLLAVAARADNAQLAGMNAICRKAIDTDVENRISICHRVNFDIGKLGPGSPEHVESFVNLGEIKAREGDFIDAAPFFASALRLEEARDPNSPETAAVIEKLAGAKVQYSKFAEAEPLYRRAIAIREQRTPKAVQLGVDKVAHADLLAVLNDFPGAQTEYAAARDLLVALGAGARDEAIRAQLHLAEVYEVQSRREQAYAEYQRLLLMAASAPRNEAMVGKAEQRLGWMAEQRSQPGEALEHYRKALASLKASMDDPLALNDVQTRLAALSGAAAKP